MTSLEEAAATLRVVAPGFLALKVFYWRALPSRRTDLELVIWALLVSLPIFAVATRLLPGNDDTTLLLAFGLALLAGEGAARVWRWAVRRDPTLRVKFVATAWDAVLARPGGGWLQVRTSDGQLYHGWIEVSADTAQADEPDLYLREPAYVTKDGEAIPISGVEGVLIPRSSVVAIMRFADAQEPEASPDS